MCQLEHIEQNGALTFWGAARFQAEHFAAITPSVCITTMNPSWDKLDRFQGRKQQRA